MRLSRQAAPLAIALLVLSITGSAQAGAPQGDWSTWGNSTHAQRHRDAQQGRQRDSAKTLTLAWSRPLDAVVTAQPLFIADSRGGEYVTATAAGTLSAFAAKNGGLRWRAALGSQNTHCAQLPKGHLRHHRDARVRPLDQDDLRGRATACCTP